MSVEVYVLQDDETPNQSHLEFGTSLHSDKKLNTSERHISKKIPDKDICMLARQLATLLRAGMPLVPALSVLVEQLQTTHKSGMRFLSSHENPLAEIMKKVTDSVSAGSTLADAVSKYPNGFSDLFVNMVAAGEMGGTLEEVLMQLAQMLEKRVNLTAKVKSAIAYPVMMIIVAICVVTFLLAFVVPGLTEIFLEMNRSLPWPTMMLISVSSFMKSYLWLIILAICVVCFAIGIWVRTKEGRLYVDRSKLKLPLFGNMLFKVEIARMTRMLGALLASGVPILIALEIARKVIQNRFIANGLDSVKSFVGKGDTVACAIKRTGLFPPIIFYILSTGQATGNIEAGLIEIADMYDQEVDRLTKTLVSLLEPAILLVMGVIVGFIVLAVLLPIFEINPAL